MGLLLLSDGPLSLDEIARQLQMSRSMVSVAARELERAGIARRLSTPGSRLVRYEASGNMEGLFEAQFSRIRDSLSWTKRAEAGLSHGSARARLRVLRELHEFWLAESDGIMRRWSNLRAAHARRASVSAPRGGRRSTRKDVA